MGNKSTVQVFEFKNGKVAKCQMYTDTAQFKESNRRIPSEEQRGKEDLFTNFFDEVRRGTAVGRK
jgi:hypothetical protein